MKNLIFAIVLGATAVPVHAQLFSGDTLGAAVLGGLIGGIVGHHSGRHTAEGVGIGAGAGLLLGALSNNSRAAWYGEVQPASPFVPAYAFQPPNYAVGGAILGGIAGGVIGHNSGRHTAEGIAIGTASGLFLGAVADQNVRRQVQAQPIPIAPAYTYIAQATPGPAAQVVSVARPQAATARPINTYNTAAPSSMAGANSLFGR